MGFIDALHIREPYDRIMEKSVPRHRSSIWYYMGGLALFFFTVQILTGVLLLMYYRPMPEAAHDSIQTIITKVPFGELIRSIHSWSANALIAVVFIHMFSTFFMKAYRSPRSILWLTGVVLFLIMLGFGFTGYLLPWDKTAYFATRIGTQIEQAVPYLGDLAVNILRGSKDVTGSTLIRLYGLHVALLPMIALAFVAIHVSITALIGSSLPPGAKVKGKTLFIPNYVLGESMLWLIGLCVLLVVAVFYPWGLGSAYDLAKPSEPPAGVHPEWYFMFLFQSLKYVPEWAAIAIYTLTLVFWTLVPWLDRKSRPGMTAENSKSPLFTWIGIFAIAGMATLTTLAYISTNEEKASAASEQVKTAISVAGQTAADTTAALQVPKSSGEQTTWLSISLAVIAFLIFVIFIVRSAVSNRSLNSATGWGSRSTQK